MPSRPSPRSKRTGNGDKKKISEGERNAAESLRFMEMLEPEADLKGKGKETEEGTKRVRRKLIQALMRTRGYEAAEGIAHTHALAAVKRYIPKKPPAKRSGKDIERMVELAEVEMERSLRRREETNDNETGQGEDQDKDGKEGTTEREGRGV